jgi:hypothetical protein
MLAGEKLVVEDSTSWDVRMFQKQFVLEEEV